MNYNNFILASFITLAPLLIFKYRGLANKDKVISFLISFAWGILSLVLSPLFVSALKYDINWLVLIPTITVSSIFNFFLVSGEIDIKKLPKTIFVIGLFFFSSLFQLIPIRLLHLTSENVTPVISSLLTLFSNLCLLACLIFLYWSDLKKDFKVFKKNFNSIFDTSLKYWLTGLLVMMGTNILIGIFAPQSVAGNEQAVQSMLDSTPFIAFLCAGVLAPFLEEVVFRKAFRDVLKNKWLFVLTSGIVFGGLHVIFSFQSAWDLLYVIPYSSLGIAFAYTLEKTDNIYAPMLMHFIHNGMLTSISILAGMVMFG